MADTAPLLAALAEERAAFQAFLDLLQTEQDHLLVNNIDALLKLSQSKVECIVTLSRLAGERNLFLTKAGLPNDQEGMKAVLRHLDDAEVNREWEELIRVAKEARLLNHTNGQLIEIKLRHNQQALSVLREAAQQIDLYGTHGQRLGGSVGGGHLIGKV
jgi:flagella synthesis protein FlgN